MSDPTRNLVKAQVLGAKICTALGVDPLLTTGVTIELHAGGICYATVERRVTEDEYDEICHVIERYRLTDLGLTVLDP